MEIKITTMEQMVEAAIQETAQRRLEIEERGLVKLTADGFVFQNGYEIDFGQLTSAFDFIGWLWHMNEKVWWTPQVQADFMELAIDAFEYPTTLDLKRVKKSS